MALTDNPQEMADEEAGGPPRREPMLNLPPMVTALLIVNVAVHGLRALLPPDTDDWLVGELAFAPGRFTLPGAFDWPALFSPVTYQFIHGGIAHLVINMTFVMAVGTAVERRIGPWRTLAFSLICGVAAAAAHMAVYPYDMAVVVGFSGAASGLFAGALRIMTGRHGLRTNRRLIVVSLVWVGVNAAVGVTGMTFGSDAPVAWVAHLGGYAAGLVLLPLFEPRRRWATGPEES